MSNRGTQKKVGQAKSTAIQNADHSRADAKPAAIERSSVTKSRRDANLLRGTSSLALATATMIVALGVSMPNEAQAAITCGKPDTNTGIVTCTGTVDLTGKGSVGYILDPTKSNAFAFDKQTAITNLDSAAVLGKDSNTNWVVSNEGVLAGLKGVALSSGGGTVTNGGTIFAQGGAVVSDPPLAIGVFIDGPGSVTNAAGGKILTSQDRNTFGIRINGAGDVNNGLGAAIYGQEAGIRIYGTGKVVNDGNVSGFHDAIGANGGSVINNLDGVITANQTGIVGADTVINFGSISGDSISGITAGGNNVDIRNYSSISSTNGKAIIVTGTGGSVKNIGRKISGQVGIYLEASGTIENVSGLIQGTQTDGVLLKVGGSFTNDQGTTTEGQVNGVHVLGAPGTVTNAGSIAGTDGDGVKMEAGGIVTNQASGSITGGQDGIFIGGAPGTVNVVGNVTGTNGNGINLQAGGSVSQSVTSTTGGLITGGSITGGADGIHVDGGLGTVSVTGSVTGTNGDGINLQKGGSVSQTGGSITGGVDGVYIVGAGTVVQQAGTTQPAASIIGQTNGINITGLGSVSVAGSVTGNAGDGILLGAGGRVDQTSGSVTGGVNGIHIVGDGTVTQQQPTPTQPAGSISGTTNGISITGVGSVTVAGGVAGTTGDGIDLLAGGGVNQTGGSVFGGVNGIFIGGAPGSVSIAGSVQGTARNGIYLKEGGIVTEKASGSITGGVNGIYVTGTLGTIVVAGGVTGTARFGVDLETGGSVDQTGGSISGGQEGIHINGAGLVTQESGTGTQPAGSITGGTDGIHILGLGTVSVAGNVTGTNGNGINMLAGTVTQTGGSVTGGQYGIFVTTAGTVTQQQIGTTQAAGSIKGGTDGIYIGGVGAVTALGNIEGTNRYGINLRSDGTVIQNAGSITGGAAGIHVVGTGSVSVAGSVTGTNGDGIDVGTGTVSQRGGTVSGTAYGISISLAGTVTQQQVGTTQAAGSIKGGTDGIYIGGVGAVTALGTIKGTNRYGINLRSDGTVIQNAGSITGGAAGIHVVGTGSVSVIGNVTGTYGDGIEVGTGTVTQSGGSIKGAVDGIVIGLAGGTVTQQASTTTQASSITGGNYGILIGGTGTVVSAGTISGSYASVVFRGGGANQLTLMTGSKLTGDAVGATAVGATNGLTLQGQGQADNNFLNFTSLDANGSKWILNGTAINVGTANVNTGILVVGDATHGGAGGANLIANIGGVTVAAPATLGGAGTVTGNVIANGTVAPSAGGPVGSTSTLTVAGKVTFNQGSFFGVNVAGGTTTAPGKADLLNVDSASLSGGTVKVGTSGTQAQMAMALAKPVEILHSTAALAGSQFSALDFPTTFAFLKAQLTYKPNDVFLSAALNFDNPLLGLTPNENAVANALDQGPANNPLIQAVMGVSAQEAPHAFDALSGEIYASLHNTQAEEALLTRDSVLDRLRQAAYYGAPAELSPLGFGGPVLASNGEESSANRATGYADEGGAGRTAGHAAYAADLGQPVKAPPPMGPRVPNFTFWGQGFGGWGHVDSDGNAAAVSENFAGFMGGVDQGLANFWRAGFAAGYTHANVDVAARGSSADVNSGVLGLYAGGPIAGRFNLRTGALLSLDEADVSRTVSFTGFFDKTHANVGGNVGQVFAELGYGMSFGQVAVEPMAGLAYVHVHTGSFTEDRDGGLAALVGKRGDEDLGYTTLGIRAATVLPLGNGTVLTPHVSAQWQYAFGDVTPTLGLSFQATGAPFTIAGVPIARSAALVDAGVDWRVLPQVKLGVSYWGDLASDAAVHAVKGTFTWDF
jgi:uncharacterized protein with beta-barrel porin domain